ncbi:hypothetical protein AB0D45_06755 [Streptomyces sp. NPDC048352]|uniref:hypothetical protein n=1 Tax=Streptomyces sp. NPDC048352 TaxID=3154718 RepID=UPI00342873EF
MRTKPSRLRVLVPSVLTAVILSGAAAAPAAAADGGSALEKRASAVQEQIERIEEVGAAPGRVAAGPIDDLLTSLNKTLQDLLKSLSGLLPAGVKLPVIELPKIPEIKLPDLPAGVTVPPVKLPSAAPATPATPATPAIPDLTEIPDIPDIPDLPIRN